MTRSARRLTLLVATALALAVAAGLLASPSYADRSARTAAGPAAGPATGPAVARQASFRGPTTQVQRIRVNWKGNWKKRTYVKTAVVPGIGSLDLICRPNDTRIRLYTDARGRETEMWLQKYEIKGGKRVVAVKTPRIFQYAHADDSGQGGTGFSAAEGLNQQPGIENRSQDGYAYGVISAHTSRAAAGAKVPSPLPVTTFELDWNWNGFNHPLLYRSCTIDATITTQFPATQRADLTWRGWQPDPVETTSAAIPGVGILNISCPTDRSIAPTVSVRPASASSSLYVEDVQGEGQLAYQRDVSTRGYDAETGLLGPYPLPSNGSLRMRVLNGSTQRWVLLSSYWVTNDRYGPRRNLCDVAAGWYTR